MVWNKYSTICFKYRTKIKTQQTLERLGRLKPHPHGASWSIIIQVQVQVQDWVQSRRTIIKVCKRHRVIDIWPWISAEIGARAIQGVIAVKVRLDITSAWSRDSSHKDVIVQTSWTDDEEWLLIAATVNNCTWSINPMTPRCEYKLISYHVISQCKSDEGSTNCGLLRSPLPLLSTVYAPINTGRTKEWTEISEPPCTIHRNFFFATQSCEILLSAAFVRSWLVMVRDGVCCMYM